MKEHKHDEVEPIFVRPKRGAKMADMGLTKFYELMNSGVIKSRKIHGMRLAEVASIKALGTGDSEEPGAR